MVKSAIIAAGMLAAAAAFGQTPDADFSRANEYYSRGDHQRAAELYQDLADRGWKNPALYYNLGNAYFKLDRLGRAIVNYRRAWNLAPRDPEINFNLAHARRFRRDALPARPADATARAQHYLAALLPLSAWKTVSAALYFLSVAAVAAAVAVKPLRDAGRKTLKYLLPAFLAGLLATALVYHYHGRETGVVVAAEVAVRYGPQERDLTAFTLHEGTEARRLRHREGWSQILLSDGKTGWVPTSALEII